MQTSLAGFQLSPQQARLWAWQQDNEGCRACCSVLLEGNIVIETLQEAVRQVVVQHSIFRTAFRRLPATKTPLQVITEKALIPWQFYDLGEYTSQEQERHIEHILQKMRKQPIDLVEGPFLYCSLATLSANKYVLCICMHSLHADNSTLQLVVREIARFYHEPLLEQQDDDAIQYIQVSEWQNELLADEDLLEDRAWWNQKTLLADVVSTLPGEHLLEKKGPFLPDTVKVTMNQTFQEHVAASYDVSPSLFLLVCWQILLWRLTRQENMVINVSVDSRQEEEDLFHTAGPLTKYLPIRYRFRKEDDLARLLAQTRDALAEAVSHQLAFCYQSTEGATAKSPTLEFVPFCFEYSTFQNKQKTDHVSFCLQTYDTVIEPFKIKLSIQNREDKLVIALQYDTNLFYGEEIHRLLERYHALLVDASAHPLVPISELAILGKEERYLCITAANETEITYPADRCMHELFEEQARRTPNAVALVCEQERVTYGTLDRQANQVAHYLQSIGVQPGDLVGICIERSKELVTAILGILKAGGAYVPLDATYPAERLAFMIADARLTVILSQRHLLQRLPLVSTVIALDQNWSTIAQLSELSFTRKITSTHLAYVIYTSGSTGSPKGVMISHQSLVNYLWWCSQYYKVALGGGSVVHSSPSFDLTLTSLFAPLLVGNTVHLLPDEQSVEELRGALFQGNDYSLVKITPAHLDLLNPSLSSSQQTPSARTLVIGGEALYSESLIPWRIHAPHTRIINEYGPTETVVGCCIYEVLAQQPSGPQIPIGRPIANTQIYLLDACLQPVPIGLPGEIYIGGHGVAYGYLNRAALTAERFIPNPFSIEPGTRLYKTGDLACYLPDGNITFLGRRDYQVKIRGFRVELGEIDTVLRQHPLVQDCVTLLREDVPNDKRLIAYVTTRQEQEVDPRDLQTYLQARLPDHMLPSLFLCLKSLPLTPNGKLDRQALPSPDTAEMRQLDASAAPCNDIERALLDLWQQVLRTGVIGREDNFFRLGGHSLLATQLTARIRTTLHVDLSLSTLFMKPTIAELASTIEELLEESKFDQHSPILPVSVPEDQATDLLEYIDTLSETEVQALSQQALQ